MATSYRSAAKVEPLEVRRLLAAAAGAVIGVDGTLTVTGTAGNDFIRLAQRGHVIINGVEFDFEDQLPFARAIVKALGGDDFVQVGQDFNLSTPAMVDLGPGNDTAEIHDGHADVLGGRGDDTLALFGGSIFTFSDVAGIDTLDFHMSAGEGIPRIFDMNQTPGLDRVLGANCDVIGNDLDNYIELVGEWGGHTAYGGRGDDTIVSTDYPDSVDGGPGNDVFVDLYFSESSIDPRPDTFAGGGGSDIINYSGRPEAVTIDLLAGVGGADGEADRLIGIENAIGGDGDDTLIGDGNRNILVGGAGNDTIIGNGGKDLLIGGAGNDLFLARDGKRDIIIGGDGIDSARRDKKDWVSEVELLLA